MNRRTELPQKDRYACCNRKHRYKDGVLQPCPHCNQEPPPKPAA